MVAFRTYTPDAVAAFLRVRERFGPFSNMAPGFPFRVGGIVVGSSEALYQAMRFPHLPAFQQEILDQPAPVPAKRHAYTRIAETRAGWGQVRVNVMRFALRAKFGATQGGLLELLRETGDLPIVEISHRDDFWGARPKNGTLEGRNVLGRLLMEIRAELAHHPSGAPLLLEPQFPEPVLAGILLGPEIIRSDPGQDLGPSS